MFIDPALSRNQALRHRSISHGPRDPSRRLLRQVRALAGPDAVLLRHSENLWLSATFLGARHCLAFGFEGLQAIEQGEQFIAVLPDHEFAITGWLVADAAIVAVDHELSPFPRLRVEADLLLLEGG